MNRPEDSTLGDVNLSLPLKIGYPVLDEFLKKKFVGEKISVANKEGGKTTYAEILGISVEESREKDFDFGLDVKFKALTSFIKNKEGRAILHLSLKFDEENQRLGIADYKLEGKTQNWLADKFLQVLVNNWLHEKIRKKMHLDLQPKIRELLQSLNSKLEDNMEVSDGIFFFGGGERL